MSSLMRALVGLKWEWLAPQVSCCKWPHPPAERPAKRPAFQQSTGRRSVSRYDRAGAPAETVVDAQREHIHVLADPAVDEANKTRIGSGERIVAIAHEQV